MIHAPTLPQLLWIYSGEIAHALDGATWLDTTRELRLLGWKVTLVAAGPADQRRVRGVEVICLPRPNFYLLRQLVFHLRLLLLILRQWPTADVILFHQMSAPWLLPLRPLRLLSSRRRPLLVMDVRSLPMEGKEGWRAKLRGAFQLLMSRVASHWVDGYLVITERMAEAINIPPERLWGVWPSGVNSEEFSSAQAARRWPSPGEAIRLIYVGALHHERNLMALSQAVQEANSEGMAFYLTLLGDGTARSKLEEFAGRSKGQIRVRPPVPHEQVPGILAQAHVGVLPFPDEEKFRVSSPIKLFEYMAAGLPIMATKIVCHTDVVGAGDYAIWAENSTEESLLEALRLVWRSRSALIEMGERAAIAANAWTWTASAQKLKRALEFGGASYGQPLCALVTGGTRS